MNSYSVTDMGLVREMNQDYFFASDTPVGNLPNLYIVADGMGGHKAGEYASHYTVDRVVAAVSRSKEKAPVAILTEAIEKANELLFRESIEDEAKNGMGTTLVIATVVEEKAIVANIGDSRLYKISDSITQITRDHSLVQEMVRAGEIEAEEAINHKNKNIITRAVGVAPDVSADFFEVEMKKKDELLLCSDGLTNMVPDETICSIVQREEGLDAQAKTLVTNANQNGGRDNITVLLIQI